MATAAPLLEPRGIGRQHRDRTAWLIRDISFALRSGDGVALTGPTGSGKTVLLRSLAMLDAVDEGEVLWHGTSPTSDEIPVYRSRAIYLPQRPRLFEGTVERNLQLPYSLAVHRHQVYSRENIVSYLDQLGRDEHFLALDSMNLSGGEIQIVALLRAIQLAPTLLLLDEPTGSLDESTTQQIEQLVTHWMSEAVGERGFVWVTHDATQTERVASRTLQLWDGQLVELETHQ